MHQDTFLINRHNYIYRWHFNHLTKRFALDQTKISPWSNRLLKMYVKLKIYWRNFHRKYHLFIVKTLHLILLRCTKHIIFVALEKHLLRGLLLEKLPFPISENLRKSFAVEYIFCKIVRSNLTRIDSTIDSCHFPKSWRIVISRTIWIATYFKHQSINIIPNIFLRFVFYHFLWKLL